MYTSIELNYALSLNYEVLDIFEIYNFSETSEIFKKLIQVLAHYKIKVSPSLFICYSHTWARGRDTHIFFCSVLPSLLKFRRWPYRYILNFSFQYSGLPTSSENENRTLVSRVNEKMSFSNTPLELKPEDFYAKPALRQQFKMILNSMLGKLAQQSHKENGQFVSSADELQKLLKTRNITNVNITNEDFCHVNLEATTTFGEVNKKGNCIVYAFITARTRILMHTNLMKLQNQGYDIFYTDCDSIIFSSKKNPFLPFLLVFHLGILNPNLEKGQQSKVFRAWDVNSIV